jgi:hypothetical protein
MDSPAEHDPAAWGRVADDGTVFVRTPEGERAVGSWQAGDPSAALQFFGLRYADLAAEIGLLETRFASGKADAGHTLASARRLRGTLSEAKVVGDLAALDGHLTTLEATCEQRTEEERAAKAAHAAEQVEVKRRLADEAEQLADSTQWKKAGDRLREIATDWRSIRIDRRTDTELWNRVRSARHRFAERRSVHFTALGEERAKAKVLKEKLLAEAKSLAESSDWKPTATRMKALMRDWKAAARADRDAESKLWTEFRAAQDAFFTRLGQVNAERAEGEQKNQAAREALLAEAEALDPASGVEAAQTALRGIQERWEMAGRVPRDVATSLDERLSRVTRSIREAADARWREESLARSPLVVRLRESVTKLEARVVRARAAGRNDEAAEAEAALETQRQWLTQAESPTD